MRSLIGSILGFSGTETVGIAGPSQFDLAVADQAEFIICDQSIDEVFVTINGKRHYLWRAVDQDDNVLDILVQSRRNKQAAKKFFRKLLKGLRYVPRVIITDKLKSYGAAKREILPGVEHRQSRYLNNRCENSHRPTRQREYRMQGFKSAGHAQRFLSAYGPIAQHFRPRRHLLSALEYRQEMRQRFESWAEITGTERAA
jgi:putative transposase